MQLFYIAVGDTLSMGSRTYSARAVPRDLTRQPITPNKPPTTRDETRSAQVLGDLHKCRFQVNYEYTALENLPAR